MDKPRERWRIKMKRDKSDIKKNEGLQKDKAINKNQIDKMGKNV